MSDTMDLEGVIEDSVNDATAPEPVEETPTEPAQDAAADTPEPTEQATTDDAAPEAQVATPGNDPNADAGDEFAKRFGLQSQSITGRENRIPYSRVKKIVERAEKEALAKAQKANEGAVNPKLTEYEGRVKDYEGRLQKVAEFENLIETRPQDFLNFLSTLPAYKEFFAYINQLAAQPAQAPAQEQHYLDASTMPPPDETLSDGSKVYSLEGLAKRDEWLARQVEAKVLAAAEAKLSQRYAPMQEQFEAEQRRQAAIPIIQKQIAEARQWPHFTEHEADIIAALNADRNITLEGAYRKVVAEKVLPKLQTDRDTMRREILEELKKKPVSTAAPVTPTKGAPPAGGKKSLEDIIAEAAATLKR